MAKTIASIALAVSCVAAFSTPVLGFAPNGVAVSNKAALLRPAAANFAPRVSNFASALRCSDEPADGSRYVKLEKTQTSWQGWGNADSAPKREMVKIDAADPAEGVLKALNLARESGGIAKYLGTSESKRKSGITGDVEMVSLESNKLVLRLVGNFWHNRQVVFSEVSEFIKSVVPDGTISEIVIEDPQQLNGFAETSNAFKDREVITEEELRKREARGTNIYGEVLESPHAKFRREKAEAAKKYDEEMARRRALDKEDEATQLAVILEEKGLSNFMKDGSVVKGIPDDDVRPEDILKAMLKA